jgi:SAM-dependent methyltransferase
MTRTESTPTTHMTTTADHDRSTHWESVYTRKSPSAVSWYRDHLETSLSLLERAGLSTSSRVIDVGGGASTLVDDLLDRGVTAVTILDISTAALAVAQSRLADRANGVSWMVGDVLKSTFPDGAYTHWHDRAVMHFLTAENDVRSYAEQVARAVAIGGHAIIGGFAPDGPEQCSGLAVARRSPGDVAKILGARFALIATAGEIHRTPSGTDQSFAYAVLRRNPDPAA